MRINFFAFGGRLEILGDIRESFSLKSSISKAQEVQQEGLSRATHAKSINEAVKI